ncbi:MAG: glycosyltransferase family 4 protein [Pseudomonadota bacterium]
MKGSGMRVLIVAGNISRRMGGEAVLPFHLARELSARGVETHALTHARVRDEILESPLANTVRFHFVEDASVEKALNFLGERAPPSLRDIVFNTAIGLSTMRRLADAARRLEKETAFDLIHQPTPVSPMSPSFLTGLQAPLIIGPMNGAMRFPPAFERDYARGADKAAAAGRALARLANRLAPGKKEAARLLVANDRTRRGLPANISDDRVLLMAENGVDLDDWPAPILDGERSPEIVFVGRLLWLKGVDMLIDAFAKTPSPLKLVIIGDGPERAALEERAKAAAPGRVRFTGFLPHAEIQKTLARATALAFPSLRDCGGAVILEAFASGTPAIAVDWGGPQDYVTAETGVLIEPRGRDYVVSELSEAMTRFAENPAEVERMGAAGRRRVETHFSWFAKADDYIRLYESVIADATSRSACAAPENAATSAR